MKSLRERIASVQHDIWSYWMKYMFTVGQFLADGSWLMPAEKAQRWQRQMNTPYAQLSEQEQASDLRQADKVILAMKPSVRKQAFLKHQQYYAALKVTGAFPVGMSPYMDNDGQLNMALKRVISA